MSSGPVCYFAGLDLAQAGEFTAWAVLERPKVSEYDLPHQRRPAYALRHLQRFPLGTPYPEVIETVRRHLCTPPLTGSVVVVEQTGVAKAVIDLLNEGLTNQATCLVCPVTLTIGAAFVTVSGVG